MICSSCQRHGDKVNDVFTTMEKVHLLSSVAAMGRHLFNNVNVPEQDKMVSSSVMTKLALSFPESARATLLQQLRQSAGIDITLKNCPHGLSVIS